MKYTVMEGIYKIQTNTDNKLLSFFLANSIVCGFKDIQKYTYYMSNSIKCRFHVNDIYTALKDIWERVKHLGMCLIDTISKKRQWCMASL